MMIVFVEHVPGEIMLLEFTKKEKRKRKQQSVCSKQGIKEDKEHKYAVSICSLTHS